MKITKREYFAALAFQGLIQSGQWHYDGHHLVPTWNQIAELAFDAADAAIAVSDRKKVTTEESEQEDAVYG